MNLAGLPPTMVLAATSLVTTVHNDMDVSLAQETRQHHVILRRIKQCAAITLFHHYRKVNHYSSFAKRVNLKNHPKSYLSSIKRKRSPHGRVPLCRGSRRGPYQSEEKTSTLARGKLATRLHRSRYIVKLS